MTILNVSWKNGVFHDRKSWSADLLPSADTVLILTTACGSRRRSSMLRLCCSFGVTLTSRHYQPETCGSVYMGTSLPRLFPPPVFDLVSFPDPPEKQERDWCSEQHFLSHGVAFNKSGYSNFRSLGAYGLLTTQHCLQKLEMATKSIGTANNRLRDKFQNLQNMIAYVMQI